MKHVKTVLALLICVTSMNAQWWGGSKKINGNGTVSKQNRSVANYNNINVAGSMHVELIKGTEGNLVVEAEENLLEYIVTAVNGSELSIKIESGYNLNPSFNKKIKITVPFKEIEKVTLSGSGKIYTEEIIRTDNFATKLSGSGDIRLGLQTKKTYASVTGSGDIRLKGNTQKVQYEVTGSGDLEAVNLKTIEAYASVTGSGDIELAAEKFLKARVTGSGDIHYQGNPEREDKKVTGSGGIKKIAF